MSISWRVHGAAVLVAATVVPTLMSVAALAFLDALIIGVALLAGWAIVAALISAGRVKSSEPRTGSGG